MGGLSTALGLFAGPPSIVSTESVVVMEWKGMSTSRARRLQLRTDRRYGAMSQGASAKPALLGPMSSDGAQTLTHTFVAEPYSSVQVRVGALRAVFYTKNRVTRALMAYPGGTLTS